MKRYDIKADKEWSMLGGTGRSQTATMVLTPGETTGGPENRHRESDQWMYVLSGNGEAVVAGQHTPLLEKTLLLIEAGEAHEIKNTGAVALRTLNFYAPEEY
ncbi:MAG: cupin domain-containing protein [Candidatus Omnitrophica bacterium]|nr:cupin domain-containing protein [Candidatus Omnitrophota bacterium]